MARIVEAQPRRKVRVSLLVVLLGVLVAAVPTGYVVYQYQWNQNSRRILERAQEAIEQRNWAQAVQSYRHYLKRDPDNAQAIIAYGRALLERKVEVPEIAGEATRILRRWLALEPRNPEPVRKLVDLYLEYHQFGDAEELARKWAELEPDSADPVLALAKSLHGLRKDLEAAETLIRTLDRAPTMTALYVPIVELLAYGLDRPEEAQHWLERGLSAAPTSAGLHMAAFTFLSRHGNAAAAVSHLQMAVEHAPDDPAILSRAAVYRLQLGDQEEVDRLLDRAGKVDARHPAVLAARTEVALKRKNPDQLAAVAAELESTASAGDADRLARAAEMYLRAGKLEEGGRCIEKLAATPAPGPVVISWLSTLRGAQALMKGQPFAAIPFLEKATTNQTDGLWSLELLASAYAQVGATDEAAAVYRRLVVLAANAASVRLNLARLEWERGRYGEALELVRLLAADNGREEQEIRLIRAVCQLRSSIGSGEAQRAEIWEELKAITMSSIETSNQAELFAEAQVLAGWPDQAMQFARQWAAVNPEERASLGEKLGELLTSEGRTELADAWAREWTQTHPNHASSFGLRIQASSTTGDLAALEKPLEDSALSPVTKGRLWIRLGDAYAARSADDSAVAAFRRAVTTRPDDPTARRRLVQNTTDLQEALSQCDKLRELEGDEGVHWRFERASALLRLEPKRETALAAIELLRPCLAARPNWVSARVLLGYAQEATRSLVDAVDSYKAAIAVQPELAAQSVGVRLVESLKKMGRFTEADVALNALSSALPDSPEVMKLLVDKQLRGRRVSEAAATAERLLNLKKDDPAWAAFTADLQLRAGNAEKSEQIARDALAARGGDVSLYWSLARALLAQGAKEKAEELLRGAYQQHKEGTYALLLAGLLSAVGKSDQAEAVVDAALEREPENADLCLSAAEFWAQRGQRMRQLSLTRKSLTLKGEDLATSLPLANLLAGGSSEAERTEAAGIVRRRLEKDARDVGALLLRARLSATARPADLERAAADLKTVLAADSRSIPAYKLLTSVHARAGRPSQAMDTLTFALGIAPDDPELLVSAAELRCHRGDYEESIAASRHLLNLQPRHPAGLRWLTTAMQRAEQGDQAIAYLERVAPEAERTPLEWMLMGSLHEAKSRIEPAESAMRKAWEAAPGSSETFQSYVRFLARRQRFDLVTDLLSQRTAEHPEDAESRITAAEILCAAAPQPDLRRRGMETLQQIAADVPASAADAEYKGGLCCLQNGDKVNAEILFQRAAKSAPQSPDPVNALAWMYCEEMGQPEKARTVLEQFLSGGGLPNPEMLDTHGTILLRLGRFDEARRKLGVCIEAAGQNPTLSAATFHLGQAAGNLGDTTQAREHFRRALQLHQKMGGLSDKDRQEAERLLQAP